MFRRHILRNEMTDFSESGASSDTLEGDQYESLDNLEPESAKPSLAKKLEAKTKEDKKPEVKKEEKPAESKKATDIDLLDDKEEEEVEEKPAKKETKADKKEEKETGKEGETKEEAKASETKKLKIRMSDGLYGIESDAKVRVKVDGDFQEVPVQELINNYSGKTAWDKKFTEIGEEKKLIESLKTEVSKTKSFLQETAAEVVSHLEDPEKNPVDALLFLVEKSGHDSYSVYKRMLESNLEEVENLMSMSEVERKAYFLEKKDEFRTKSDNARKAESTKEQAFKQAIEKVDSLRQAHGVSEEQYLQALDELESQGTDTKKMSDEQVVDYASLKPHITTIQDVLEPFEDSIDDSKYSKIVPNLARQLRAKEFSKEQLIEWARKEFMDEDLKDLQSRTKEVTKRSGDKETKVPQRYETLDFDDED